MSATATLPDCTDAGVEAVVAAAERTWYQRQLRGKHHTRADLARGLRHPDWVWLRLAKDRSSQVRWSLAHNTSAPTQALQILAAGGGPVGEAAARVLAQRAGNAVDSPLPIRRRTREPVDLHAVGATRSQREQQLSHPDVPYELVTAIMAAANPEPTPGHPSELRMAQYYYCHNPSAQAAWLGEHVAALLADPSRNSEQLGLCVRHPNTPAHALLAVVPLSPFRHDLLTNPNCPGQVVLAYAEHLLSQGAHPAASLLVRAAMHPQAPLDVLYLVHASAFAERELFAVLRDRATSAEQASAVLTLAPGWTGTLGALLAAGAAIAA